MENSPKKTGILFSLPVCIVATFFVFPIGIILIFMRLYKKGKISRKVKNIGVGVGTAFIGVLVFGLFTLPEVDTPGVVAKPKPAVSEPLPAGSVSQDTPSKSLETLPAASLTVPEPVQAPESEPNPAQVSKPEPDSEPSKPVAADPTPSSAPEPVSNLPISYLTNQKAWAEANKMVLVSFSAEQQALSGWLSKHAEGKLQYVSPDHVFGENQYKITRDRSDYLYCGELKDNFASGYGILYCASEIEYGVLEYENRYFNIAYIGQFEKGRFEGYGLQFNLPQGAILSSLQQICHDSESSQEFTAAFQNWVNFVTYEGMFKDGRPDGSGNMYKLDLARNVSFVPMIPLPDVKKVEFDSVTAGNFQGKNPNGECKVYLGTYLWYEGEMKDGKLDGYGREYYRHSDVVEYEGHYKNDMRHGEGTSYDVEGNVEYNGKWKYGDYA